MVQFSLEKLGNQFVISEKQETLDKQIFESVKLVAIYFGADWAPPCKSFLPTLIEFYNQQNQENKQIEIIYISMDQD